MKFSPEHYHQFQESYSKESDRSVAILAAAYLEHCLEEYLRLRLVDDPSVKDLFSGFAPIATFSAKIDIAFAVGLLPPHIREDLRRIKKIRNLFAHDLDSLTFDAGPVRDICDKFSWPRSDGTRRKAPTARAQFLNAVFWCLLHIYTERDRTSRLPLPKFHFEEVVEDKNSAEPAAGGNAE